MNGSAINHIDKYIEPTPNKIAGVVPRTKDMDRSNDSP